MYDVYLAHHGILGQKWGVRRFQNKDGSLTTEGKRRYKVDENGNYVKMTKAEQRAYAAKEKSQKAALEKARKARAEKAEYNKGKAEAIKSGDASKVEKYFNDLSPEEVKQAMDRINTKQNFQRMLNNEASLMSDGKTKADRLMENVGKATNYAEKGIAMYNVIAKVNNAFSDRFMPQIGSGQSLKEYRKQLEKDRKEAAEKEKAKKEEREENERKKFVETASAREIISNIDKVRLNEWENIGKRFKTQETLVGMVAAQGEKHRKIGIEYTNKYRGLQTKRVNVEYKQHEREMEEIAKRLGINYEIDSKYEDRWRR